MSVKKSFGEEAVTKIANKFIYQILFKIMYSIPTFSTSEEGAG